LLVVMRYYLGRTRGKKKFVTPYDKGIESNNRLEVMGCVESFY
jgi:hypothetical protein